MGTRRAIALRCAVFRDHPHACGDKVARTGVIPEHAGSSPRVWGQVLASPYVTVSNGIIPTRVGTRILCKSLQPLAADHPHACGDKSVKSNASIWSKGSSPRVWGQVSKCFTTENIIGIIPTRVGTRICGIVLPSRNWDHPHACGDKQQLL